MQRSQECLDLIENKSQGILAVLEEQSFAPRATDQALASRLCDKFKCHACTLY